MDLAEYLNALEGIKYSFRPSESDSSQLPICAQFYQTFLQHVVAHLKQLPVETALSSLVATIRVYTELRCRVEQVNVTWDQLGHVIFIETARVVLGLDFQRLDDSDPQGIKAVFKQTLTDTSNKLQPFTTGEYFLVLTWLVAHGWSQPILQSMMKGEDVDEETALTFLRSGEYQELFRLRVDMLMENGCDDFALNLSTWCTKSPIFQTDPYIRQAQLLLLIKLNRQEEFHTTCQQIWQEKCCLSKAILQSVITKAREDEKRPLLTLTQTFLVHDWMKSDEYCCTEALLELWLSLQREQEPNADDFIQSVSKMDQLARHPRQLQILIKALKSQFGLEFQQFCMECALKAVRMDRKNLDTARIYMKDDGEADKAADSLTKTCIVIALLFGEHHLMKLAAKMTAFYMDPSEAMYHEIRDMVKKNPPPAPIEGKPPPHPLPHGLDESTYFELLEAVDTLRPKTYNTNATWAELSKPLRMAMEEAGYLYNTRRDTFVPFQEKLSRSIKAKMERMRKKSLEAAKLSVAASVGTSAVGVVPSTQQENPTPPEQHSTVTGGVGGNSQSNTATASSSTQKLDAVSSVVQQPGSTVRAESPTGKFKSEDLQVQLEMNKLDLQSDPNVTNAIQASSDQVISVNATKVQEKPGSKIDPTPGSSQDFPLLSEDATEMPFMDITLEEIQQVLDNSSQGKDHPLIQEVADSKDSAATAVTETENTETSEELVLNTIKEFLKEGDVDIPNPSQSTSGDDFPQSATLPGIPGSGESCAPLPTEYDDPNIFKCKYCGKAYDSMRQRRRHQEWLCRFKINSAAGEKDIAKQKLKDEEASTKDDKGQFSCGLCKQMLTTMRSLRRHERRVHNIDTKQRKVMMPSGVALKNCSVQLDRLEDAPSAKSSKPKQTAAGRSKDGISKLMSKKYSSGFFKGNQKQDGSGAPRGRPRKSAIKKDDLIRLTSEGDSSETDVDYELVSTFEFDSETGDAQVQVFVPDDRSQAVLCDFCGHVCHNYQDMRNHQQTCKLTPKKSPSKEPKFDMNSPQITSAIAALFQQDQTSEKANSSENQASLVPACPNDSFRNLLRAIPQASYATQETSHHQDQAKINAPGSKFSPVRPSVQSAMHRSPQFIQQTTAASPKVKSKSKPRKKSQDATVSKPDIEKQKTTPPKLPDAYRSQKVSPTSSQKARKLIPLSYRICLTCGGEFQNASTCFKHQADMSHFSKGVGLMSKFKCSVCSQVYNSPQEGELHMKTHEPKESSSSSGSLRKSTKSPAKNKSSSVPAKGMEVFNSLLVYCPYCQKGFLSQNSLQQHLLAGCDQQVVSPTVPQLATPASTAAQHSSSGIATAGMASPTVVMSTIQNNAVYPSMGSSSSTVHMQVGSDIYIQNPLMTTSIVQPTDVYLGDPAVLANQMISFNPTTDLVSPTTRVRHEAAVQVNIDEVPLTGAADLPLDTTFDEEDNLIADDSNYVVAGDVEVEKITFKNILMLRHKIWLCSHCNKEFALKKDVSQHWETTTCKNKFSAQATDTYNYQCIYCGEMFPEPKDCRDHQFASCLKDAGMKIQQLKNKHFHCKKEGCKGRYYERCHVERHLIYFHKVNKAAAANMVQEWFPDSFMKSITKLLSAKKEAKSRSRSPEKRDTEKSISAASLSVIHEMTESKTGHGQGSTATTPSKDIQHVVDQTEATTTPSLGILVAALTQENVPTTKIETNHAKSQGYSVYDNKPMVSMEGITVLSSVGTTLGMPPVVYNTSPQVTPSMSSPIQPPSHVQPSRNAALHTDDVAREIDDAPCSSPVPTCNISWSPSSASLVDSSPSATPTKAHASRSKARRRKSSADRSSSVESQRSQKSPKQKRVNGKYPVAPAEHHPCPKCGKIIEDRLALQFHLEWTCSMSPNKLNPPQKKSKAASKKREKSPGSSLSVSQDSRDSRSCASDDASRTSLTQASNTIPSMEGSLLNADKNAKNPSAQPCLDNVQHQEYHAVSALQLTPPDNTINETVTDQIRELQIPMTDKTEGQTDVTPSASTSTVTSPDAVPRCNFCGIIFGNSIDLERHVLMMHPQVINYVRCHACNTLCDGLRGLKAHFCIEKPPETEEVLPEDLTLVSKEVSSVTTQVSGISAGSGALMMNNDDTVSHSTPEAYDNTLQQDMSTGVVKNEALDNETAKNTISVELYLQQAMEMPVTEHLLEETTRDSCPNEDLSSECPPEQTDASSNHTNAGIASEEIDTATETFEKVHVCELEVISSHNAVQTPNEPRSGDTASGLRENDVMQLESDRGSVDMTLVTLENEARMPIIAEEKESTTAVDISQSPAIDSANIQATLDTVGRDAGALECDVLNGCQCEIKTEALEGVSVKVESSKETCGLTNCGEVPNTTEEQTDSAAECAACMNLSLKEEIQVENKLTLNSSTKDIYNEIQSSIIEPPSVNSGQNVEVQPEISTRENDLTDGVTLIGEYSSQCQPQHDTRAITMKDNDLRVNTTMQSHDLELCSYTEAMSPGNITDNIDVDPEAGVNGAEVSTKDASKLTEKTSSMSRSSSIDSKASDSTRRSARGVPRKSYNELEDVDIVDFDHSPPMMKTRKAAASRSESQSSYSNLSDDIQIISSGIDSGKSVEVESEVIEKQECRDAEDPTIGNSTCTQACFDSKFVSLVDQSVGKTAQVADGESQCQQNLNSDSPPTDCQSRVSKAVKAWRKPQTGSPNKRFGQMSPKTSRALASKTRSLNVLLHKKQNRSAGYFEKMKKICSSQKKTNVSKSILRTVIPTSTLQTDELVNHGHRVESSPVGTAPCEVELVDKHEYLVSCTSPTISINVDSTAFTETASRADPENGEPDKLSGPGSPQTPSLADKDDCPGSETQPAAKTPTNQRTGASTCKSPATPFSVKWQTFGNQPRVGNISISVHKNTDGGNAEITCGKSDFEESHMELQKLVQVVEDVIPDSAKDELDDTSVDVLSQEGDEIDDVSTHRTHCTSLDSQLEDTSSDDVNDTDGRYACPFCDEECSFLFETELIEHLKNAHGLNKGVFYENKTEEMSCPVCKDHPNFADEMLLHYHMRTRHNIANYKAGNKSGSETKILEKHSQKIPDDTTTSSDVRSTPDVDSASSTSGSFLEGDVDKEINIDSNFQEDQPSSTAEVADPGRTCVICNIAFLKTKQLHMHMARFHKDKGVAEEPTENPAPSPVQRRFKCTVCSLTFSTLEAWKVHFKSHSHTKRSFTIDDWSILKSQSHRKGSSMSPREKARAVTILQSETTASSSQAAAKRVFRGVPLHVKAPITYSKRDNASRLSGSKKQYSTPPARKITINKPSKPEDEQHRESRTKQEMSRLEDVDPIKEITPEQCQKTYERKWREKTENPTVNNVEEISGARRIVKKRRCSCECDEDRECQKVVAEKRSTSSKLIVQNTKSTKPVQADGRLPVTRRSEVCRDRSTGAKNTMPSKWCVWEHFLRSTLKKQSTTTMRKQQASKSCAATKQVAHSTDTHVTRSGLKRKSMSPEPISTEQDTGNICASDETCIDEESPQKDCAIDTLQSSPVDEGITPGVEPMESHGKDVGYESEQSVPETRSGLRRRRSNSIGSCTTTSTTSTRSSRRLSTESLNSNSTSGNKQSISSGSRCSSPIVPKRKKLVGSFESNSELSKRETRSISGKSDVGCGKLSIRTRSSTSGPLPKNYRHPERLPRSAVTTRARKK